VPVPADLLNNSSPQFIINCNYFKKSNYNLFALYTKGYNLQIDPKNLEAFFRQNAAAPTSENLCLLGSFLVSQKGKEAEGKDLLSQAIQKGSIQAHYYLGQQLLKEKDTQKALQHLLYASREGFDEASLLIAQYYASIGQDFGAINYFHIAANQGNKEAQKVLSSLAQVPTVEVETKQEDIPQEHIQNSHPTSTSLKQEITEGTPETKAPWEPEPLVNESEEKSEETSAKQAFLAPPALILGSEVPQFLSSITPNNLKDKEKDLSTKTFLTVKTIQYFDILRKENRKKLEISDFTELATLINNDLKIPLICHGATDLGYKFSAVLDGKYQSTTTHRQHKKDQKRTGAALHPAFVKSSINLFEAVFDVYDSKKS
jgi:hypothetical protein